MKLNIPSHNCKFNDDTFNLKKVANFNKKKILSLIKTILNEKIVLRKNRDLAFKNNDIIEIDELSKIHKRKILQMEWLEQRLVILNTRELAGDKDKSKRQKLFHEIFFKICQHELERKDFKEICAIAYDKLLKQQR